MEELKKYKDLCIHRTFTSLIFGILFAALEYYKNEDPSLTPYSIGAVICFGIIFIVSAVAWEITNILIKLQEKK